MSLITVLEHVKSTAPGVAGVATTGTGAFLSWVTESGLPLVHVFASLGTGVAGFATGIYYFSKWLKNREK